MEPPPIGLWNLSRVAAFPAWSRRSSPSWITPDQEAIKFSELPDLHPEGWHLPAVFEIIWKSLDDFLFFNEADPTGPSHGQQESHDQSVPITADERQADTDIQGACVDRMSDERIDTGPDESPSLGEIHKQQTCVIDSKRVGGPYA